MIGVTEARRRWPQATSAQLAKLREYHELMGDDAADRQYASLVRQKERRADERRRSR